MPMGLERARARLDQFDDEIKLLVDEKMGELAERIAEYIRNNIRVDTGALQATVRVEDYGEGWIVIVGSDEATYAIPLDRIYGLLVDGSTFDDAVRIITDEWVGSF